MASNKRTHEDDPIVLDSHSEGSGEHGPASKKAKEGGGLDSAFADCFSNWEAEKTKLEKERREFAAEKKAWDETSRQTTGIVIRSPVRLNVGGVKFETSPETLRAQGGSFFAGLLSGRLDLEPCTDKYYFIDRDPTHFHLILNYLRGLKLDLINLSIPLLEAFKIEAEFYTLGSLVAQIDEMLRPTFVPGLNYSLDSALRTVTKTGNGGWDAIIGGPLLKVGATIRIQIVRSVASKILIGLGSTTHIPREMHYEAPGFRMLDCSSGIFLDSGKNTPYFGKRISAPSIVEVQVDDKGDVYYIIDGVKQAKAFSVAAGKRYRLLVLMYAAGDQIKLL